MSLNGFKMFKIIGTSRMDIQERYWTLSEHAKVSKPVWRRFEKGMKYFWIVQKYNTREEDLKAVLDTLKL